MVNLYLLWHSTFKETVSLKMADAVQLMSAEMRKKELLFNRLQLCVYATRRILMKLCKSLPSIHGGSWQLSHLLKGSENISPILA